MLQDITDRKEDEYKEGDRGADSWSLMYNSTQAFWVFRFFGGFFVANDLDQLERRSPNRPSFTDNGVSPCRHRSQHCSSVPKSNPLCISGRYQHLRNWEDFPAADYSTKCKRFTSDVDQNVPWQTKSFVDYNELTVRRLQVLRSFFNDMEMSASRCLHFLSQRGWASSDNKSLLAAPLVGAAGPRSIPLRGWMLVPEDATAANGLCSSGWKCEGVAADFFITLTELFSLATVP